MKKHSVRATGFYLIYDRSVEGSNKWVICHHDRLFLDAFFEAGNDQLWHTKAEAIECIDCWLYKYAKS